MSKRVEPVRAKLTSVIAERAYRLVTRARTRQTVRLRFGKPRRFPEGGNYYCVFQIDRAAAPPSGGPAQGGAAAIVTAQSSARP